MFSKRNVHAKYKVTRGIKNSTEVASEMLPQNFVYTRSTVWPLNLSLSTAGISSYVAPRIQR